VRRTVKVSLDFATKSKRNQISGLLREYRAAVNFYIKYLWTNKGSLNKETLAVLENTRLSERYKSNALKQALSLVVSAKKSAKALKTRAGMPVFKGGAILDAKFVTIEDGAKSFDLVVKLSTLRKGRRITIPTRHTKMSRKWLGVVNSKLVQGCCLSDDSLTLFIEIPELLMKTRGKILGLDMGVEKLISDSDGNFYGTDFKEICKKIRRKKPGSKGKARALSHRKNYIGMVVNRLPWGEVHTIGVEDLRGIKKGKSPKRGKNFRKAMAPWVVRQVISRIENKASENRVRLVKVNPAYTSQTCPVCRTVNSGSRKGEKYLCAVCGYAGDSDTVGAHNIFVRTCGSVGRLESPMLQKKAG
jgi:IS605 OrfB family transposase